MSTGIKRKTYAKLFFIIFFMKMVISSIPIFIHNFDRDTLIQVILQLEIENNNGKSGLGDQAKDLFLKHYGKIPTYQSLLAPPADVVRLNFIPDDDRDICPFYPSVPTPPPNC